LDNGGRQDGHPLTAPAPPLQPRGRHFFAVVRKPVNSHFETQRRRGHRAPLSASFCLPSVFSVPLCFQLFFSVRTLGITVRRLNVSSGAPNRTNSSTAILKHRDAEGTEFLRLPNLRVLRASVFPILLLRSNPGYHRQTTQRFIRGP
jgi:hypothetical protein